MKYTKKVLMISMAAIIGVVMITPSINAYEHDPTANLWDYLDVHNSRIVINDSEFSRASLSAGYIIPRDGSEGAFGYGIISDNSLEAVLVTTSHAGVLDSEVQIDENDAIFHNHYVALQDSEDGTGLCSGLEIRNITFEELGTEIHVATGLIWMQHVPYSFSGTDSLTGEEISFLSSGSVTDIVSFTIEPILDLDDDIVTVCINDVSSIDSERINIISRN